MCCVGQSSFALPADSASGGLNARGALPFDSSTAFKMERLWGGEKREHLQEPRTTKMKKASTSGPTVKGYFLLCTFFVCASVWVGGGSKVKRVGENVAERACYVSLCHHTADPRKERAGEKSSGLCWVPSLSASPSSSFVPRHSLARGTPAHPLARPDGRAGTRGVESETEVRKAYLSAVHSLPVDVVRVFGALGLRVALGKNLSRSSGVPSVSGLFLLKGLGDEEGRKKKNLFFFVWFRVGSTKGCAGKGKETSTGRPSPAVLAKGPLLHVSTHHGDLPREWAAADKRTFTPLALTAQICKRIGFGSDRRHYRWSQKRV